MIKNVTNVNKSKKFLEKNDHLLELKNGLEQAVQQTQAKYDACYAEYITINFELRHLSENFIQLNELKLALTRLQTQLDYVNTLLSDVIYANVAFYTDVHAYEVIRMKNPKTAQIRRLKATFSNPEEVAETCTDGKFDSDKQLWDFEVDESGEVLDIEQRKTGGWYTKTGKLVSLSKEPVEFYDFNV